MTRDEQLQELIDRLSAARVIRLPLPAHTGDLDRLHELIDRTAAKLPMKYPEPSEPVHMLSADGPRSRCGVASGQVSTLAERVTCADCLRAAGGER